MATTHARHRSLLRTAPYLGVACLALLAFASVHAFAPDVGATAGRAASNPALSWLAAPAAPQALVGAAAHLVAHAADLAATQATVALADAALLALALALLTRLLRRPATRPHGGLSTPALLVAVALARAH